jgi:hypothetical protein
MRKNMVDVVMKMKISVSKYIQIFNRVSSGYGVLAKFIIITHYAGFSKEGYNFSCNDVEF